VNSGSLLPLPGESVGHQEKAREAESTRFHAGAQELAKYSQGHRGIHAALWGSSRITAPPCPVTLLRKPSLAVFRRGVHGPKSVRVFTYTFVRIHRVFLLAKSHMQAYVLLIPRNSWVFTSLSVAGVMRELGSGECG
jgi:hypothetical protein